MSKIIRYGLVLLFLGLFIGSSIYFYYHKDGYLVTFNSNGGSIIAPVNTGLKKQIDVPVAPTREGYTFVGWYLDNEKFDFALPIEDNITLIAHWEKKSKNIYTLFFDSLGGSKIEDIKLEEGSVLKDVPVPVKDGYEFVGWMYHNQEFNFENKLEKNMVFVAKYKSIEENKDTVTIRFDSGGGSLVDSIEVSVGGFAKMPKEPIREGYIFAGWYLDGQEYDFLKPIYQDIILDALWQKE